MTVEYEFNHDVETVQKMLVDPGFLAERLVALGEDRPEVRVSSKGRSTILTLQRTARRDLPKIAAKFIGGEQRFEMTEKWRPRSEGWKGEYHIDVVGAPLVIDARFELTPTDSGCIYTIHHEARVKIPIPIAGRALKTFLVKQIAEGSETELDYLAKFLG
jgi:hypothetical protein